MVNICLRTEETSLLRSLKGKELIKYRHDSLDKFDGETVYGRVELFFNDSIILIDYDYAPYPLFGSQDDERPIFSVKKIKEEEAISALKDVSQINIKSEKIINGITLVEDSVELEWDNKKDNTKILKAIIIKFDDEEIAFQGDYMIPLLDIIKGKDAISRLQEPGYEYRNEPEVKYTVQRNYIDL